MGELFQGTISSFTTLTQLYGCYSQAEVKCSPSMRKVFERIRTGQFPGFEDVWVRILENLEYRAPAVLMEEERTM